MELFFGWGIKEWIAACLTLGVLSFLEWIFGKRK